MNLRLCKFNNIAELFNFGRYDGLSLADVLDINPQYVHWCVKHCAGMHILIYDCAIKEIKAAYPEFIMDNLFKNRVEENFDNYLCDYAECYRN